MSRSGHDGAHDHWEDEAAAYALGALDGDELHRFEEHLAICGQCREQLAMMHRTLEALPAEAAARAAPPELKERVMDAVRAEAAESKAPVAESSRRRRFAPPGATWPRWALPGLAAAAAAAVAIALVSSGGGSVHTYAGTVSAPGAKASVHQSGSNAQLEVSRLPAPPPGRIYEVWLERAGQAPVPARALFATTTGSVTVPSNLRGVQAVLVSAEPRPSGSRKPTRTPIIVVRLT
jgi:anti-sigma-K factor RskA